MLVSLAFQLFCGGTRVRGQFVASQSLAIFARVLASKVGKAWKDINKNVILTRRSIAKVTQRLYYDFIAPVSLII